MNYSSTDNHLEKPMASEPFRMSFLLVICLFAGCGGLISDPDSGSTMTPADVPTDTPAPPQLAPGLTTEGVSNPMALSMAHRNHLENRSFSFVYNRTIRTQDGGLVNQAIVSGALSASKTEYHVVIEGAAADQPNTRTMIWSNGTHVHLKDGRNASPTVLRTASGDPVSPEQALSGYVGIDQFQREILYQLFHAIEVGVTAHPPNNNTSRYQLRLAEVNDPSAVPGPESVNDVQSFQATVTGRGVVQQYYLVYTGQLQGESVHVVQSVNYSGIGTTTIVPPSWTNRTATTR